jgi:hypothetical protein
VRCDASAARPEKERPATPRRVSDVLDLCMRRLANDPQIQDLSVARGSGGCSLRCDLNLSDAPLRMRPGDVVGIDVWYSSHYHYTTFTVQSGGQHLDLTFLRAGSTDFTFDWQIRPQSPPGVCSRCSRARLPLTAQA